MCTATYTGKGLKERTRVCGERPIGTASFRQHGHRRRCRDRNVATGHAPKRGLEGSFSGPQVFPFKVLHLHSSWLSFRAVLPYAPPPQAQRTHITHYNAVP